MAIDRLVRRPADGFGAWRRESICSCGNGMTRRDAQLQSDKQRPWQRHPPSASLNGRGEGARSGGGRGERGREEEGRGG